MTMFSHDAPRSSARTARTRAPRPDNAPESNPAPGMTPLAALPDQRQLWIANASNPIPFADAAEKVLEEREKDGIRADVIADLRAWGFGSSDGKTMQVIQTAGLDFGGTPEPIALRKRAFGQLCDRVDVPRDYIARLPAKLQIVNMNYAMSRAPKEGPALLRRAGGDLRAIVSDRYAAFDDDVLLQIVDDVLKKSGYRDDALVRASAIGPEMILRLTIPHEGVQVRQGDVIEWGIDLGNSELGMRSVQVTPMSYRLVCLNGMRNAEAGWKYRHVGDTDKIRQDLEVAIPAAFAEARGDIGKWQRSVDAMIDDAMADLEGLRSFGITAGEQRAIGRTLLDLPEEMPAEEVTTKLRHHRTTVYDLTNAMTATARDRSDVTSRLSLEETAHRYLERKVGA